MSKDAHPPQPSPAETVLNPPLEPQPVQPHRVVTLRALLVGIIGVILICTLTPYNDYALNNTFLVGNNLPLGVIMLLFLFTLLINGPLMRFAPRYAFSSGEVTVIFAMILVSCTLPSSGLMRSFPGSVVMPLWHAGNSHDYRQMLESMELPAWIFPRFQPFQEGRGSIIEQWIRDPVVQDFYGRTPPGESAPYTAWIRPALVWGIFIFALYGALLCMVAIVRRQWHDNERLPFPLAQIQLALVEQPPPRKFFNSWFSQRSFWIAFFAIFSLHLWNGCHQYWAKFPEIPVDYKLWDVFADPPWVYMDAKAKHCAIFFTALGVAYFLSTSVSFSLWFCFIGFNIYRMMKGSFTGDNETPGMRDQHFGGLMAFFPTLVWVGRKHWALVGKQMIFGERTGEPRGYISYPLAGWGLVFFASIMIGFLKLAGCTWLGSIVPIMLLLFLFLMITRIIAEAGLMHGQLQVSIQEPWSFSGWAGIKGIVPVKDFYFASLLQTVHYDFREVLPVYASHSLKVADSQVYANHEMRADTDHDRRTGRKLIGAIVLALFVGYFVSLFAALAVEYKYAQTLDKTAIMPINRWGAFDNPGGQIMWSTLQYQQQNFQEKHNPAVHVGIGFVITGVLAFMRLRYTWWPIHPIGYIMPTTFPGAHFWFSIFWGWLCKVLIVKFGGATMYRNAKPVFLGLIVGESVAAGFWLLMGIFLNAIGVDYRPVNIMPG